MNIRDKYQSFKLGRYLRKEQRAYAKEKRRCAAAYTDWRDDEFNCLDLKFVWALQPEYTQNKETPSFVSLNDAIVYFNRATRLYSLQFDPTFYDYEDPESLKRLINKMNKIEEEFAAFVYSNPQNHSEPIKVIDICTLLENNLSAPSLEELRIVVGCRFKAAREWIEKQLDF